MPLSRGVFVQRCPMFDPTETIDSQELFQRHLTNLINAAERGDINVEGGYDIVTSQDKVRYDIEVCKVVPRHG